MPSRNLFSIRGCEKKKKPLVMMVGPKYGFWSASTREVRNGIAKKLMGESHI